MPARVALRPSRKSIARTLRAPVANRHTRPARERGFAGSYAALDFERRVRRLAAVAHIHLPTLPEFEKQVRVALEWTLDLFFPKDFVQYLRPPSTRPLIPCDDPVPPLRVECQPFPEPIPPP